MSSGGSSEEETLRQQLIQAQRDKMILLDQLAMVKVTVCFNCQKELPQMESSLQQCLERRTTRLNKLRESVVRVSDSLYSEQRNLQKAEEELLELRYQTAKMTKVMEQEQENANDLKKSLDALMGEKSIMIARKKMEMERLNDIQAEIGQVQATSHVVRVSSDLIGYRNSIAAMEAELRELAETKDNLEMEVFTIHEYLRLKNAELEKAKEQLKEIKMFEEGIEKNKAEQLQVNSRLKVKLDTAENELKNMRAQLNEIKEEKIFILDTMADEREALESAKQQEEMTKEDTLRMQRLTNTVLQENLEAKQSLQEAQSELWRISERQNQLNVALAAAKGELEESQRLLEFCKDHQKESQETLNSIKCKMLNEFSESRKQIRVLQEERRRHNKELSKASVLPAANKNAANPDFRVKEICDTLIGGIIRVAPDENIQSVLDHIKTDFAEYLKKHSIAGENDALEAFSRSHSDGKDQRNVDALQDGMRKTAASKEKLVKENEQLEEELADARKKNQELLQLKSRECFELKSTEEAIEELKQVISGEQRDPLEVTSDQDNLNDARKSSSLEELFEGANKGLKNPYPNMRN